ncbi:MAG: response regulator [Bacteroidia bacterium]
MEKTLHLLLANEEKSDCLMFSKALSQIPITSRLKTVHDGEELMKHLLKNTDKAPDLLFLDFNMPFKSGAECLSEIKQNKKLKNIPVVIYSTNLRGEVTSFLYEQGAHYYIQKVGPVELKITLHRVLNTLIKNDFERPARRNFIFNVVEV